MRAFVAKNKDNPQRDLHGVQYYSNVPLDYWDRISLLDSVFNAPEYKNTPVVLGGADAHTGWANQAMLRKAGLTTENSDMRIALLKRERD